MAVKNAVRIIGGKCRGHLIPVLELEGLRPTPNRVKETLFNWLQSYIRDAVCLDAFAGSGGLGFEAYSRGARQVVMVESSPLAHRHLKSLVTKFNQQASMQGEKGLKTSSDDNSNDILLVLGKIQNYFKQNQKRFDLVFLDPPFSQSEALLNDCMTFLSETDAHLNVGGLVYIETSLPILLDENIWLMKKQKKAGQVCYSLYEKKPRS